jgi:hypothetical protein
LRMKIETIKSITPPKVMLIDESRIGVIWIDEYVVRYSMKIDSIEIVVAYTKTTQDF